VDVTFVGKWYVCALLCVLCTHVCVSVSSVFKPDPHAFIFALTNAAGLPPFKVKATKEPGYAVYHYSGHLTTFGAGDLLIASNSNTEAGHTPPGATPTPSHRVRLTARSSSVGLWMMDEHSSK
jgi:hypothetical protein